MLISGSNKQTINDSLADITIGGSNHGTIGCIGLTVGGSNHGKVVADDVTIGGSNNASVTGDDVTIGGSNNAEVISDDVTIGGSNNGPVVGRDITVGGSNNKPVTVRDNGSLTVGGTCNGKVKFADNEFRERKSGDAKEFKLNDADWAVLEKNTSKQYPDASDNSKITVQRKKGKGYKVKSTHATIVTGGFDSENGFTFNGGYKITTTNGVTGMQRICTNGNCQTMIIGDENSMFSRHSGPPGSSWVNIVTATLVATTGLALFWYWKK